MTKASGLREGRGFKCTFYKAALNGGRKAHHDETALVPEIPPTAIFFIPLVLFSSLPASLHQ